MSGCSYLIAVALVLVLPVFLARCWFLAPTRFGWLFYYPNLVGDFLARRLDLPRVAGDLSLAGIAVCLILIDCDQGLAYGLALALLLTGLELCGQRLDRKYLTGSWAIPDIRWRPTKLGQDEIQLPAGAVPNPNRHPLLTVSLHGPFTARSPRYDLGTLHFGRNVSILVTIGNHSVVPAQVPLTIAIESSGPIRIETPLSWTGPILKTGEVARHELQIHAEGAGSMAMVRIQVACGSFSTAQSIHMRFHAQPLNVQSACITRYPGASKSAFAWRGDMDHYDTVTFQSIAGLREAFGLAARYRMPQTMYLSSRLTVVPAETEAFYGHYGVERGQAEVGAFIRWVQEFVDLQHRSSYPFESAKPYLIELGNHMHLHYGTDAAADAGNDWCRGAGIGAGVYPWQEERLDSFTEQRDNALRARKIFEQLFRFTPKSWAMPDSTRDAQTPRAVEAAGCEVLSDSDARHVDNVVFQPSPHHPTDSRAVELTKRYPGDPETYVHATMIVYWLHRAWRRGIPVVFMCHQHMRQFAGTACTRFTEYVLRYVLERFNGDLHINTVYGIGAYWNAVFSPVNRCILVQQSGNEIHVENNGNIDFESVPVDVVYQGGGRATMLVDLPARTRVILNAAGEENSSCE